MATTPQYVAGYEGYDIYPTGALAQNFPWFITNTAMTGTINTTAGAFGGGALTFPTSGPTTMTSGTEWMFNSTMQPRRTLAVAANGNLGCVIFSGWLNILSIGTMSGPLLALGTDQTTGEYMPILYISNATTTGLQLQFVTNVNSPTSSPLTFALALNTQYWVTVAYAYSSNGTTPSLTLSVTINGSTVYTDRAVTWSSDLFTGNHVMNRLKFFGCSNIQYTWDDHVIQAVSSADATWPLTPGVAPTPETIPVLSPRQVFTPTATANGTTIQMTASGSEPNYQSATDTTGANYVTATSAGQTDTYKWNLSASAIDIRAVQMRGNANRYQNLIGAYALSTAPGTPLPMASTINGPSRYLSVVENDGTNMWTQASITGGEFGQTSR